MLAKILKDETVEDMGNVMRSKRNLDLYAGGVEVTEKEISEYIKIAENAVDRVQNIIKKR